MQTSMQYVIVTRILGLCKELNHGAVSSTLFRFLRQFHAFLAGLKLPTELCMSLNEWNSNPELSLLSLKSPINQRHNFDSQPRFLPCPHPEEIQSLLGPEFS